VGYAAFVAYMSLKPFRDVPLDLAIDRIGRAYLHLPAYAVLGALVFVVLPERGRRWRRAFLAFLAAAGYGWALEVAQIPAPTRSFNLTGLVFDALGAALGAAAALGFAAWRRRSRRSV